MRRLTPATARPPVSEVIKSTFTIAQTMSSQLTFIVRDSQATGYLDLMYHQLLLFGHVLAVELFRRRFQLMLSGYDVLLTLFFPRSKFT